MSIPSYKKLCNPIIQALHERGGSAPVRELEKAVADMLHLSKAERNEKRADGKTRLGYRIAWARYYLKRQGILARVKPGTCSLSEKGKRTFSV